MNPPLHESNLDGHYAGAVTRTAAYLVDMTISTGIYALAVSLGLYLIDLVTGLGLSRTDVYSTIWALGLAVWLWLYYSYCWAVSGKTPGMAIVGLRVVRRDGSALDARGALVRAPALALTFATLGIGFIGILIGRERRALHDVLAGSAVVYGWDARAARLRFLARVPEPASG